ncbi:MAG TPA: SDR family NAD(P)-dependent oxidoreductase, partial [Stellaceae bacterium]|nr:SDR family NAD(P)-dependent oxidoreductase [Stellaceae bacterium]
MEGLLTGRLALVTGAGSGIGQGIARGMAQAGARIVAVDINGDAARRTAQSIGGGAQSYACDVADRGQCDALAEAVRRELGA